MVKRNYILILTLLFCVACEFKLKPSEDTDKTERIEIKRYDRLESRYLTTGDFSALQQMNTGYPIETRTLIEDVLQLGEVNDPEINSKFLKFYQDTLLQTLIADVETQYADIEDINQSIDEAFKKLTNKIPNIVIPSIYTQIGALDQSIVVGDKTIGVSLDKYLGSDYPLYKKYYKDNQVLSMKREYIVPDCLNFYILSLFPMKDYDKRSQLEKDLHMGKTMWAVNNILGKKVFQTNYTTIIDNYMKKNKKLSMYQLLKSDDYSSFK